MSWTDDPLHDFEQHEAEMERKLRKCPVCDWCGEYIQDEMLYDIQGELVCEDCMSARHNYTDNYIDD